MWRFFVRLKHQNGKKTQGTEIKIKGEKRIRMWNKKDWEYSDWNYDNNKETMKQQQNGIKTQQCHSRGKKSFKKEKEMKIVGKWNAERGRERERKGKVLIFTNLAWITQNWYDRWILVPE